MTTGNDYPICRIILHLQFFWNHSRRTADERETKEINPSFSLFWWGKKHKHWQDQYFSSPCFSPPALWIFLVSYRYTCERHGKSTWRAEGLCQSDLPDHPEIGPVWRRRGDLKVLLHGCVHKISIRRALKIAQFGPEAWLRYNRNDGSQSPDRWLNGGRNTQW